MRVKVRNNKIIVSTGGNTIFMLNEQDARELHRRLGETLKNYVDSKPRFEQSLHIDKMFEYHKEVYLKPHELKFEK